MAQQFSNISCRGNRWVRRWWTRWIQIQPWAAEGCWDVRDDLWQQHPLNELRRVSPKPPPPHRPPPPPPPPPPTHPPVGRTVPLAARGSPKKDRRRQHTMRRPTRGGGEAKATRGAHFSGSFGALLSVSQPPCTRGTAHSVSTPPPQSEQIHSRPFLGEKKLTSDFACGSGEIFVCFSLWRTRKKKRRCWKLSGPLFSYHSQIAVNLRYIMFLFFAFLKSSKLKRKH